MKNSIFAKLLNHLVVIIMSTFTFTPGHFISSNDGVLRELEYVDVVKATVVSPDLIPKDREYIIIVPQRVKVSKKLLCDTPDNVVFIINDSITFSYIFSPDNNIRDTKSHKCFYIHHGNTAFTDSRLLGLELKHIYYSGIKWCADDLTLSEYFERVMPKKDFVTETDNRSKISEQVSAKNWDTLFENAFKEGYKLREEYSDSYLERAIKAIPNMIKYGKREQVFILYADDDLLEVLNEKSPKNVKWSRSSTDHTMLSIDY